MRAEEAIDEAGYRSLKMDVTPETFGFPEFMNRWESEIRAAFGLTKQPS